MAAKQALLKPQYKDAITEVLQNVDVSKDLQSIDARLEELGDAKLLSPEGREKTELQKQRAVLEVAQAQQNSATTYADSLVKQSRELETKSNAFDVESQQLGYEAKGLANKMAIAKKIQIPADSVRQNMLEVAGNYLGEGVKQMKKNIKEKISDAVDAVRPALNAAFDSAFEWFTTGVREQEVREAAKEFMNMTSWAESLDNSSEAFKYWLIGLGISGVFLPFLVRRFSIARKNREDQLEAEAEAAMLQGDNFAMSDTEYRIQVEDVEAAVNRLGGAMAENKKFNEIKHLAEMVEFELANRGNIYEADRNDMKAAIEKLKKGYEMQTSEAVEALGTIRDVIDLMKHRLKIGSETTAAPWPVAAAGRWQSEQEYAYAYAERMSDRVSKLGAPPLPEQRTNLPDSALNTLLYSIGIKIVRWDTADHTPHDIVGNVYYVWHPVLGFPSRDKFPLDERLASEMGLKFFPITKADWDYRIPGDQKMNAVRFHGSSANDMPVFMVQTMDKIRFMTQMLHLYAWRGERICNYEGREKVFDRFADLTGDITWLQAAMTVNRQTATKKLVERPVKPRILRGAPLPLGDYDEDFERQQQEYERHRNDVFKYAKDYGIGSLTQEGQQLLFNELNINHDQVLDVDELTRAYKMLSGKPEDEARQMAQDAVASFGGKGITFPQFEEWVREPDPEITGGGTKTNMEEAAETEMVKPPVQPDAGSGMGEAPETVMVEPLLEPVATAKAKETTSKRSKKRSKGLLDTYLDESDSDSDEDTEGAMEGEEDPGITDAETVQTPPLAGGKEESETVEAEKPEEKTLIGKAADFGKKMFTTFTSLNEPDPEDIADVLFEVQHSKCCCNPL